MVGLSLKAFLWVIYIMDQMLLNFAGSGSGCSWCPQPKRNQDLKFEQKSEKFWEFEEETNRWVEVSLPFDLMSCINESCTKVGSIESKEKQRDMEMETGDSGHQAVDENHEPALPVRKRISLTLMAESSIWITGQSGSIFERFWNGVQWVIAPHELPTSAGHAVSVFIVNQTILSLSEAGLLYQLQLNEHSQPIWTKLELMFETNMDDARREPSLSVQIKSGLVSHDGERLYVSTTDGSLLEVSEMQPLRPPGGDVSAVADAGTIRPGVVFIVSSDGDLYEFDKTTKPSWKKHIWSEALMEEISLITSPGSTLQGLVGAHSVSLFLLTKKLSLDRSAGWIANRAVLTQKEMEVESPWRPQGHYLSAITKSRKQNEPNDKNSSLFITTTTGLLFEYQLPKHSVHFQGNQVDGLWVNHMHPRHAKVARGVRGVQLQFGRMIFALDDGRLAELHFPGIGGEGHGPNQQISLRRKASNQYEWSVLEVPETEGWNAEYCTDERGPSNCILGIKDMPADDGLNDLSSTIPAKRRKAQERLDYISLSNHERTTTESSNLLTKSIDTNFRMRAMHADRSFFMITESGLTFEYLYADHVWLWLRHEHSTEMKGAVGSYNGSLFLVDTHGSLLMRERNGK
ncbi:hypothetical protein J5N97_014568 [Dioscorea zingiberensis]|uniref:Uncharacterized protein n=1 Tax=Dioscorea zingiberensis TaxID=325984 RepID=A0A9D5CUD6_9LILI|nr:hypothetical protein J5N97_014568 [Dioscorea zingiberensis]